MSEVKKCACGCGQSCAVDSKYYSKACRNRAYRRAHGIPPSKARVFAHYEAEEHVETSRGYIAKIKAATDPRTHRYGNITS